MTATTRDAGSANVTSPRTAIDFRGAPRRRKTDYIDTVD